MKKRLARAEKRVAQLEEALGIFKTGRATASPEEVLKNRIYGVVSLALYHAYPKEGVMGLVEQFFADITAQREREAKEEAISSAREQASVEAEEGTPPQPFGPPDPPPAAARKEKRTSPKRARKYSQPLPSEAEILARSEAAEARYNAPGAAEERERARKAQEEAAKARRQARIAQQKKESAERTAQLKARLLSGEIDDPEMLRVWLTREERIQAHKAWMARRGI